MALAESEFARLGDPSQVAGPGLDAAPVRAAALEARDRAELLSARAREIDDLRGTVARLEQELLAVRSSASWRLTRPLRSLAQRHPRIAAGARGLFSLVRTRGRAAAPPPEPPPLPPAENTVDRIAAQPEPVAAAPSAVLLNRPSLPDPTGLKEGGRYHLVVLGRDDDIRRWAEDGGVQDEAARVTIAPGSALDAWWSAVCEARRHKRHLLVLLSPLPVQADIVALLLDELDGDPMLGTAQPRFADPHTDQVWPLPPAPANADPLARACLKLLPPSIVTAELLSACMLIRPTVVAAMEPPCQVETVQGAISFELSRARRRGFRNVVVNRAVVPCSLPFAELYPNLMAADASLLHAAYPDRAWADEVNQDLLERALEPLLAAAYPGPNQRRRLLVDCRGLACIHNGTSQCILGILDGFAALDPDWTIHVQSTPETAAFHKLASRYGGFVHHTGPAPGKYAAVLLANQPWSLDQIADLHRQGLVVGCNMLDTISWDILYAGPRKLDRVWRFVARHMDVISFISAFSQARFRRRFEIAPAVRDGVVPLSLAADEQLMAGFPDLPVGEHVLLFGNAFEHKAIGPTLRLLSAAFPRQRFVVLGGREEPAANVEVIAGGSAEAEDVHRLVASARALVFPSFYEGFGLPVLEGLAYGRPVLVRRSALWAEIAAGSRFDAPLIEFDDGPGLIEALGDVLAGACPSSMTFGAALAAADQPWRWRDTAAGLLNLFEIRLQAPDLQHWRDREDSLRFAGDAPQA